jgi:hypothetical protein
VPFSTKCETCQPGTFAAVTNATECTTCDRGQFNELPSGIKCFECPRGWATDTLGSDVCTECEIKYRSSVRDFGGDGLGSRECIPCLLGEVQPPKSGECFYCAVGFFSLYAGEQLVVTSMNKKAKEENLNHANCHDCPFGAACRGGNFLRPLNGFWRSNNFSVVFTECFFPPACEGAKWEGSTKNQQLLTERNESCRLGYTGRLCHACIAGWGRMTFDTCQDCPPKGKWW